MAKARKSLPVILIAIAAAIAAMVISSNRDAGPGRQNSSAIAPQAPTTKPPSVKNAGPRNPPALPTAHRTAAGSDSGRLSQPTLAQLLAAAKTGNASAGCRAARELHDCLYLRQAPVEMLGAGLAGTEKRLEATRDFASADRFAHAQLGMLRAAERCKEAGSASMASMHVVLRQAALAGNRAAMLKYGSGEFLGLDPGLEATRHPGYGAWRSEAPAMAFGALRAGSLEAAFALGMAYGSDAEPLSAIVPDDPLEAAVYEMLLDLGNGDRPETRQRLTTAQQEAALRRAKKLHQEIFAGGLAPVEATVLGPSWFNADDSAADPCG